MLRSLHVIATRGGLVRTSASLCTAAEAHIDRAMATSQQTSPSISRTQLLFAHTLSSTAVEGGGAETEEERQRAEEGGGEALSLLELRALAKQPSPGCPPGGPEGGGGNSKGFPSRHSLPLPPDEASCSSQVGGPAAGSFLYPGASMPKRNSTLMPDPDMAQSSAVVPVRDVLALLAAYMAAIIHDYDHRGVNNHFLVRAGDPLALLYNDSSPMENHHVSAAFTLLREEQYNFLWRASQKVGNCLG